MGKRRISFSRELYIDASDFMEEPIKKYFRLFPENEVRLKSSYVVKCTGFKKNEDGSIAEIYCEYDPESRGGNTSDGRKVKGTIQWVDANTAVDATVNLYDNLFTTSEPEAEENFIDVFNENSLKVIKNLHINNLNLLYYIIKAYKKTIAKLSLKYWQKIKTYNCDMLK